MSTEAEPGIDAPTDVETGNGSHPAGEDPPAVTKLSTVPQSDSVIVTMLKSRDFWRQVTAEFAAMFVFVFICVGCALATTGQAPGAAAQGGSAMLSISLCFGMTIFMLIHCFGHISGANINPAVTLALVLTKRLDPLMGISYTLAHYIAAIAAAGLLMAIMGLESDTMGGYNALTGSDDNKIARGLTTEIILTFTLCFSVLATVDPNRNNSDTMLGPLAIGTAVGVAHLIAVPITGCGINPARSLGPAIFANNDDARAGLWVFILGPYIGAATAAVLYPFWFSSKNFAKHGGEHRPQDRE